MKNYNSYSLWLDTVDEDLSPRTPMPGDTDFDVAIVGGGFTGLWTAYYMAKLDRSLRIAVLEKEICGYGKDMSMYSLEDYTQIKHVMTALD